MNYNSLKATINANVKQNGNQEITGIVMNSVLNAMVNALAASGMTFGGAITPSTPVPTNIDQATAFLAPGAGTYEHFLDSNGDPIVVTSPSLIMYDGGQALIFTSMTLPFPQVLSVVGGNSLIIPIPDFKNSYRIDMTAQYTGGSEERYIGSLILEVNDLAMQVAHGYYYGYDMAEILSECAIWKNDPEFYPDDPGYCLLLTTQSDLDEVIFSVSPMDGKSVQMYESNEDEKVKVADATITPVGSGGGDGKIGVISQTQTWSGTGSNPRTYVMSNKVTGLIPQANIDIFESAGATFNATSGYFELNGLTDISYEEMKAIMRHDLNNQAPVPIYTIRARTALPQYKPTYYSNYYIWDKSAFANGEKVEAIDFFKDGENNLGQKRFFYINNTGASLFCTNCRYLKNIYGVLDISAVTGNYLVSFLQNCGSLERVYIYGLKTNLPTFLSSVISKDSLLFLIEHEVSTSAITITLHASVYAKCQSGGEWYSDISTALAAHTNISLASA